PTGYLHLGHVVNALYVWKIARELGGEVVLRLENHDRIRCKPEYEAALLQDLEWLGFVPDLGKPEEFRAGASIYRQSDGEASYRAALDGLRARGLVYACDCSRRRIVARASQADTEELRYDGHCRDRGLADGPGLTLRLRLPDRQVSFEDGLQGLQIQHPSLEIGDFALRDNHGHWTYQFCVVVDDIRQDISLIVRGMDILSSTGRQIILAELLGQASQPLYVHHPLLVDAAGKKLSKRDFAADIHSRMLAGEPAKSILEEASALANL
ncbi:MAG TPA: glutamate--tRNA ligase family protein, partial [Bacteroidia bacterium]|nr:glutamate--tRNA ligase family protein [Bacteroidia bacterium]